MNESDSISTLSLLQEATPKIKFRVNFRGQRIKKKKCPPGFRLVENACIPATAKQKQVKRIAIRKAVRSKKANVSGARRAKIKRLKALKKRKEMGLKKGQ